MKKFTCDRNIKSTVLFFCTMIAFVGAALLYSGFTTYGYLGLFPAISGYVFVMIYGKACIIIAENKLILGPGVANLFSTLELSKEDILRVETVGEEYYAYRDNTHGATTTHQVKIHKEYYKIILQNGREIMINKKFDKGFLNAMFDFFKSNNIEYSYK